MINDNILFQEFPDEKNNRLGLIILNRPKALNALSKGMFHALEKQLTSWKVNSRIKAVLIKSTSEKAFCAGGDIRAVYENREWPVEELSEYFTLEYGINDLIHHFPKPTISFLNGITMGGGVGISIHGSHPIGTENLKFAMPETLIGLFPDVGASYYLARLPKRLGFYLGLTGQTIGINDACFIGLMKYFVSSDRLEALEKALVETPFLPDDFQIVTDLVLQFTTTPAQGELAVHADEIEVCFSHDTVEDIMKALQNGSGWAKQVFNTLLQRSPTSLKVTLEQFKRAAVTNFDGVMRTDFRLVCAFLAGHDFFEGIRAAVIDKDRNPQWKPASLAEISHDGVLAYFK